MLFRSCLFLLLLTSLFIACCSEESGSQLNKQLQNVLSEEVLQLIQNHRQAAAIAKDSADLSTAHHHLKVIAQIYVDYQQWDSLYLISRKVFREGYAAQSYEPTLSFLYTFPPQIPLNQDTIKAKLLELIGFSSYMQGDFSAAKKAYNECAEIWEQHYSSRSLMNSYNMLGNIYTISGEYPKAIQTYQSALVSAKRLKDTTLLEAYYDNLGKAFLAEKKWKKAIESYEDGHQLGASEAGKYEYRLAEAYLEGKQLNKAEAFAKQALKMMLKNQNKVLLFPFQQSIKP